MKKLSKLPLEVLWEVLGHIPTIIILARKSGKIESYSPKFLELIAEHQDELDDNILHILNEHSSISEHLVSMIQQSERPSLRFLKIGMFDRVFNININKVKNRIICTLEDITRVHEIENKLLHAVIEGQEAEKRRISQELHDGIGPLVSTLKMKLESEIPQQDNESYIDLLDEISTDIRSISHALSPSVLHDFGLEKAIENFVLRINDKRKENITFYPSRNILRLTILEELNLYRILQEGLNNALKHAFAKNIDIQLIQHKDSLVMMIEDDGTGLIKKDITPQSSGNGLWNMKARAQAIGADLDIDTLPGRGTTITIEKPTPQ